MGSSLTSAVAADVHRGELSVSVRARRAREERVKLRVVDAHAVGGENAAAAAVSVSSKSNAIHGAVMKKDSTRGARRVRVPAERDRADGDFVAVVVRRRTFE